MDVDEPVTGFRWETDYERTWEAIQESKDGRLQSSRPIEEIILRNKRLRALQKKNLRLGLMRHIFIVLDLGEAMSQNDLKPTRIICTLKLLSMFLNEFSSLNPISQIGLLGTRNKKFEILSPMGSDMRGHMKVLDKLRKNLNCTGEPSLQNSLEYTLTSLKHMPNHTSKEVIIILGSLTTCDPGDIHSTIQSLASYNIRCSVINLSAEVCVCKRLVSETKGSHDIVMDDEHFKSVLFEHLNPPPAIKGIQSSLIKMGFSQYVHNDKEMPSMCTCHLSGNDTNFSYQGYYCPQCHSKYCDLPIGCHVCGLTLVSASHLARSFHHLFPVELFKEELLEEGACFSCDKQFENIEQIVANKANAEQSSTTNNLNQQETLTSGTNNHDNTQEQILNNCSRCALCKNTFCFDCDIFIHESLHFCPGCSK